MNEKKCSEYNARLNNNELSIKGIVKNGEDYYDIFGQESWAGSRPSLHLMPKL